jgi:hypothetical protein
MFCALFSYFNTNSGIIIEMINATILGALRRPAGPELSSREPTRQGHLQLLQCVVRWRGVWLKSGELHIREPLGAAPADEVDESRVETWSMGHSLRHRSS